MLPHIDDNALLSTVELSAAFRDILNLPLSPTTLEAKRSRGNGPPFQQYEKIVRYRWGTARDWRLGQRIERSGASEEQSAA
jgi:hypothetical protein